MAGVADGSGSLDNNKAPLCEPCGHRGKTLYASVWCNNCEEYHCDTCASTHSVSKASKGHTMISTEDKKKRDRGTLSEFKCDPCKALSNTSIATKFCGYCKEYLCMSCYDTHTAMKVTRTHQPLDIKDHVVPTQKSCDKFDGHSEQKVSAHVTHGKDRDRGDVKEVLRPKPKPKPKPKYDQENKCDVAVMVRNEKDKPGKPTASKITADTIALFWEMPEVFVDEDTFQVRYKDLDSGGKWKLLPNEYSTATTELIDLKANTKFLFQVRKVHNEVEGPYSDVSDEIKTLISPGWIMIKSTGARKITNEPPYNYAVPLREVKHARFVKAKSRKFEIGPPVANNNKERTIMLVGATGTGKSTLVDGLVNYILGVNWNDPYRFTVIDMENEEKGRSQNQALSQTEWITCYTINPAKGSRLDYKLTMIDTPGFGDTRGIKRDKEIVDQIRELFSAKDAKGVLIIDAVCFLIKAPDARLTATQTYIFHSIMSLFGQDIKNNICTLVTFADGQIPPVLASLKQSKLPFGKYFTFNNSALFSPNTQQDASCLSPMFWEMGVKSYMAFFDNLAKMETKSLALTKEVLEERQKLELTVSYLQPRVDAGLSKISQLEKEGEILKKHKADISDNKDFEYEVEEVHAIQRPLPEGIQVTNCLNCHATCHDNCVYADDDDKRYCRAMDKSTGNCLVCSGNCTWQMHKNLPFIYDYVTKKVKKTYVEQRKKYEKATGELLNGEQVLKKMCEELESLHYGIGELMKVVNASNNRLKEIALSADPLSMVEYIDQMIESEKLEKKSGWEDRIIMFMSYKKKADIHKDVARFSEAAKESTPIETKDKSQKTFNLPYFLKKFFS